MTPLRDAHGFAKKDAQLVERGTARVSGSQGAPWSGEASGSVANRRLL